jgi:small subunit ribosomal protein S16
VAVRIRMTRTGRRNRASFRLGAFDSRTARDGRCLELLGFYDPGAKTEERRLTLKDERIKHWLSVGALPSERVTALLKHKGILPLAKAAAVAGAAPKA